MITPITHRLFTLWDSHLDPELIARLRDLASRGASVRMMVNEIREHFPSGDHIALEVDRYLTKAFHLRLLDVRQVEASSCLGGKAYIDVQIDQLLLPKIASTRHLWQQESEDRRGAGEKGIRPGKGVRNQS
jgi:hypothetical protein